MKKQKIQPTGKSELVTPLSKITPPPPPTYLSKNSYLKHLSLLKQFTLILFTVISIAACNATENNEAKTSSQAEITELTVTINSIDYPITFDTDRAFTVSIPAIETIPGKITVKSSVISKKASGLQANDELIVTNNQVLITITAEDGTSVNYTLKLINLIIVVEMEKINPDKDRRYHYVLFTIRSGDGTTSLGRHKLALKLNTDPPPSVQDMREGAGVYRIINSSAKKVLLSYTLGSGILDIATNANYLGRAVKDGDTINGEVVDVDSYLLIPNTSYTLYALKDGGSSVETAHSFTTDDFVPDAIPLTDGYFNDPAMGGEYSYDMSDEILVLPISLFEAGTVTYELLSSSQLTDMRIGFTAGIANSSPIVRHTVTTLTPSHFSDSTNYYLSINGKHIIGYFVVIPSSHITFGSSMPITGDAGEVLLSLTPTLDQ